MTPDQVSVPLGEDYPEIRDSVRRICADFPNEYWTDLDEREARISRIAPISTNLILAYVAEHVLGMPRSY